MNQHRATAALAAFVALAAGQQAGALAQGTLRSFLVEQQAPVLSPVDLPPAGPSAGDMLAFEAAIRTEDGAAGTLRGNLVTVDLPDDGDPFEDRLGRPATPSALWRWIPSPSICPVLPASRAACSRGTPSSALASASRRALTRPSRSRRANRRSSAGLRSGRIGNGADMARVPGSPPVDNAPAAQPIRHQFVRAV